MASEPASRIPAIDYETRPPEERGRRPKWLYVVLCLYAILLLSVTTFPLWFGYLFLGEKNEFSPYAYMAFWTSSLLLAGVTLMIIPVRKRSGRLLKRRALWLPLVGAALLMGGLVFATMAAIDDAFPKAIQLPGCDVTGSIWLGAAVAWALWILVFGWMSLRRDPVNVNSRMYKTLATGNFLELVIAVPMHIIARQRTECCAGMASGAAIGAGTMIAVVVLGPAIFFLYYRRWGQVYARKKA